MYVDLTNNYKLVAVAKRIKNGDQTRVANETGFTQAYVSRVLNGDNRFNQSILNAAYRLVYRRETVQEKLASMQA
jgi:DNA-binding LacI/PurR family transcriptional regulator